MNELVEQDIREMIEVLIPSGFTISLVQEWISISWVYDIFLAKNVIQHETIQTVNQTIQSTGTSIIVLLTIGFLAFKFYRAVIHFKWKKSDRFELQEDNQE